MKERMRESDSLSLASKLCWVHGIFSFLSLLVHLSVFFLFFVSLHLPPPFLHVSVPPFLSPTFPPSAGPTLFHPMCFSGLPPTFFPFIKTTCTEYQGNQIVVELFQFGPKWGTNWDTNIAIPNTMPLAWCFHNLLQNKILIKQNFASLASI